MFTLKYERNGKLFECDFDKLPAASQDYLKQYGFSQSLQDSAAGPTKKAKDNGEDFAAAAEGAMLKRLDAILDGNVAIRGVSGESRDSLRSVANAMIRNKLAELGKKVSKEKFAEFVEELLTNQRAKVQAEFDRRKAESADIELDI